MEDKIRQKLGIPNDAEKVLIFAESSHWDINWMFTSEKYYQKRVRNIIDRAIEELLKNSKRIYSIESVFFLKLYWERNPSKRETIRFLVNKGRIRMTGSGFTTPDTILPESESIIRDYLYGQEWLRENGMHQEPRLAYLPDNFGNSPNLPGLLQSMGYEYTSVARIDGMHFPGSDYAVNKFPLPGSSAELLGDKLKTSDFIWRGLDGSEVLCHWNAFTYGHGDTLDTIGPAKFYDIRLFLASRTEPHIARKIHKFVRQLSPLAKTPYLFCPIGMDFNSPIPDLLDLLDRYNKKRYPATGIYVVNAGMDDYLDLVSEYKKVLPTLNHDPNPYWMGFYTSRPGMKQRCSKLVLDLVKGEKLLYAAKDTEKAYNEQKDRFKEAWELTILTNHHDFITGTSPTRVWKHEQKVWINSARNIIDSILKDLYLPPEEIGPVKIIKSPTWDTLKGILHIENPYYKIEIDENKGGCIVLWEDKKKGINYLSGLGNDAILYKDTGGLWRLGHEFNGGTFRRIERASEKKAQVETQDLNGVLEVKVTTVHEEKTIVRTLWFKNDSPIVRMRLEGSVIDWRTVTCSFETIIKADTITMNVPGGIIERPLTRNYDPTYWAFKQFAYQKDLTSDRAVFIGMDVPANISSSTNSELEWIAIRNTKKERAFGLLPVLAHPAMGASPQEQKLDYAVCFSQAHNWHANRINLLKALEPTWIVPEIPGVVEISESIVDLDNKDVRVMAIKPADRGEGTIIRLLTLVSTIDIVSLKLKKKKIKKAVLCDALERDITDLAVKRGTAYVPIGRFITSVRVL